MIAANNDWGFDLSLSYQIVHGQPELHALAVAQPTDARWQPLKLYALTCQVDPALQDAIVGKQFQH